MKQKKPMNMMIFIFLLVGVFVTYIVVTGLVKGCEAGKPVLPAMTDEELKPYLDDINKNGIDPVEYINGLFAAHDVVFLGNMWFFEALQAKQQVELVIKLVPPLYKQGVAAVGIINVLARDQEEIDRILTAPDFDEKAVVKLLFDRAVIGGSQEYVDLFRAVWNVNKDRPVRARPMRILGLSPEVHFENMRGVQEKKDKTEDPEIYKKIFGDRLVDDFILDIIDKQVVEVKARALIFLPQENCIIRYISQSMVKRYQELGFTYKGAAAYQLHQKMGERCVSVFLHTPWWVFRGANPFPDYPAEGLFDVVMNNIPSGTAERAVSLASGPFGDIELKKPYWLSINFYLDPGENLRLKDLCDAYIILGPLANYTDVTPIKGFINESNFKAAADRAPWAPPESDNKGQAYTPDKMNEMLDLYPNFFTQMMDIFKE
jgi:hypothetical protein